MILIREGSISVAQPTFPECGCKLQDNLCRHCTCKPYDYISFHKHIWIITIRSSAWLIIWIQRLYKCRREILLHEDKTVRYERLLTKVVGNKLRQQLRMHHVLSWYLRIKPGKKIWWTRCPRICCCQQHTQWNSRDIKSLCRMSLITNTLAYFQL